MVKRPRAVPLNPDWPVLKSYTAERLARVAMPLGGIGTGTVSLGGRGQLLDWELRDHPDKGFTPEHAFFALWTRDADGRATTRCLEGDLGPELYHTWGSTTHSVNHGLPRFRACSFSAAYPLAQVCLADPAEPVSVRIEAFNPLIPADADASGWPIAVLRFVLTNRTDRPVRATVAGSVPNFLGEQAQRVNESAKVGKLRAVVLRAAGLAEGHLDTGSVCLAAIDGRDAGGRTRWAPAKWGQAPLEFWDDLTGDGKLDQPAEEGEFVASVASGASIPAGGSRSLTFLLAWHFPHRRPWQRDVEDLGEMLTNHYATRFDSALDAAARFARAAGRLERQTVEFVRSVAEADLPEAIREAALFNLSTLRSQTVFRTADGTMFGWEGCCETSGCCNGSCTHVWNYEPATAHLFGELAWSMREVEFLHATDDEGFQAFRKELPLDKPDWHAAAADGQMGTICKLYRQWRLSGDDERLARLWPRARKALAFCWLDGSWDADADGVMEGCQHNTMDVEYYGPNPQMTGWYLAALRAGEQMADHLGERDFAERCRDLFERGSAWMDENLFNGEYYEHHVQPMAAGDIREGLVTGMGAVDPSDPAFQLAGGCLVDQLVGQYTAHIDGLGYLHRPAHVRKTLRAIYRHNFRRDLHDHFNNMRTYALGDEAATLMCSYPRGGRPAQPFPYFAEVMTGFEYTAAVGMLQEGLTRQGLKLIEAIRARYDGRRRNPFDEAECGHHYARAMASWAALLAWTGFGYSAGSGVMTFADPQAPVCWPWSTGQAWGTVEIRPTGGSRAVTVRVGGGRLSLRAVQIRGAGEVRLSRPRALSPGRAVELAVQP